MTLTERRYNLFYSFYNFSIVKKPERPKTYFMFIWYGSVVNFPGDTRKQSYFVVNYKPLDTAALIGYDKVNPASLFSYDVQRQKNQICLTVGVGYRMIFSSY